MLIGARVKAKEDAFNRDGVDRLVKGAIYTVTDIDVGTVTLYRLQYMKGWWSSAKFDVFTDWEQVQFPCDVVCTSEHGDEKNFLRIGRGYTASEIISGDFGFLIRVRDYKGDIYWQPASQFKLHTIEGRQDTRLYYKADSMQGCFG